MIQFVLCDNGEAHFLSWMLSFLELKVQKFVVEWQNFIID